MTRLNTLLLLAVAEEVQVLLEAEVLVVTGPLMDSL
jgi:hypothetical protein